MVFQTFLAGGWVGVGGTRVFWIFVAQKSFFCIRWEKGRFLCMNYQDLGFMLKEMGRIPYPELLDVVPNERFGRLVYEAYAGSESELTTILSYVFQHLTNGDCEEVATLLKMIAVQEMKHLDLLGELLVKLRFGTVLYGYIWK